VGVSVSRGVLELQGSVATDADRRQIEAVARAVPRGTVMLTDRLEVSTRRDRDDAESDRRIEHDIEGQTDVGGIHVTSRHGLVTVAGRVSSEQQAAHVLYVANTTPGVAAVDDELKSP
jgi:osmotically-inducible protein OsmY